MLVMEVSKPQSWSSGSAEVGEFLSMRLTTAPTWAIPSRVTQTFASTIILGSRYRPRVTPFSGASAQLKKLLAEAMLDNAALKDLLGKNG